MYLAAVEIYGTADLPQRGGMFAFNGRGTQGAYLSYAAVERLAELRDISLRPGCCCNPGAAEAALAHNSTAVTDSQQQSGDVPELAGYRD